MNIIPLQPVPNQSFNITLDNDNYDITIREVNGSMAADITRNGTVIINGVRIVAGTFVLPYLYMEPGNFIVTNLNEDLIYYTAFGVSQSLVYLSADDLAVLRSS